LLLIITDFIGRFHPVLVHLPIGILLLGTFFYFLSLKKRFETLQYAVKPSLLLGLLSATASCISGYLLSISGEYEQQIVSRHQWFGIGVAIAAAVAYVLVLKNSILVKWVLLLMVLLLVIAGHLGGSITHGEDYLTKSFSAQYEETAMQKPVADVQNASAYNDIIQPILKNNCYSCHGAAKQKGKLRLDEITFLTKGGESGNTIVPGQASESELIKRMLLPLDNEDHMPPKEKRQPTKQQLELLQWWISSGADYHKKVSALNQPEKIKGTLLSLQNGTAPAPEKVTDMFPLGTVEKAPKDVIEKLKAMDVAVTPVVAGSNYLSLNFAAIDLLTEKHTALLMQLNKQIVWLKMGNVKASDSTWAAVGRLTTLFRLHLNNTGLTDGQLIFLKNLSQLQVLNLSGTKVSDNGITILEGLNNLQKIYLHNTLVSSTGIAALRTKLPKVVIDTGGYKTIFIPTDTIIVKSK
jgi:uncharacterized membrane protein